LRLSLRELKGRVRFDVVGGTQNRCGRNRPRFCQDQLQTLNLSKLKVCLHRGMRATSIKSSPVENEGKRQHALKRSFLVIFKASD
jgi:hypothetical protein